MGRREGGRGVPDCLVSDHILDIKFPKSPSAPLVDACKAWPYQGVFLRVRKGGRGVPGCLVSDQWMHVRLAPSRGYSWLSG